MNAAPELDAIASLRVVGEKLPPSLRAALQAAGEGAIPGLLAILEDEDLAGEDGPGGGWAPIHAVDLLADLKAHAAIEPMIHLLATSSWDETRHDRIVLRLPDLGPAVMEPALAALDATDSPDARDSLCCILAKLGVRDDRVYKALCGFFEGDETLGANSFADDGDDRALPLLRSAIEGFEPSSDGPLGMIGLADLVEAYEELSGTLPDDLREHVDALYLRFKPRAAARRAAPQRVTAPKIGRNDPCPCSSGRKYKKCCLGKLAP